MAKEPENLRTQVVANGLDLSVSTIKRWVDAGAIKAVKTAGKHRLIPRSEARRLARELGKDERIFDLADAIPRKGCEIDDSICERLYRRLHVCRFVFCKSAHLRSKSACMPLVGK